MSRSSFLSLLKRSGPPGYANGRDGWHTRWISIRRNRLAGDATVNLASQVSYALASLVTAIVTSRALGRSDKGVLTLLIITPIVLQSLLDLGVAQGLTVSVATGTHHQLSTWMVVKGLLGHALAALVVSALIARVAPLSGIQTFEELGGSNAWLVAIAGPLVVLTHDLTGMLYGFKDIAFLAAVRTASAAFVTLTTVLLFARGADSPTPYFSVFLLGIAGSLFVMAARLRQAAWEQPDVASFSFRQLLDVPRAGLHFYGTNISYFAITRLDSLLLGGMRPPSELGLYANAVNLAEAIWYFPATLGQVVLPYAAGTRNRVLRQRTIRLVCVASLLGALMLGATGHLLLPALFGQQFADSYGPLLLLLPGAVGMSCTRICQTWLLIYGQGSSVQRLNAWAAGTAALFWAVTIPRYGLYAAAVVSSLVYGGLGAITLILLRRATAKEG